MSGTVEQFDLFGGSTRHDQLGVRQRAVMEAQEAMGRPLDPDEAGAVIHAQRGKHPADERCQWCAIDGRTVLDSLKDRGGVGDLAVTSSAREPREDPSRARTSSSGNHLVRRRENVRARRTDPLTSHEAAESVGPLRESQLAVLEQFAAKGPMHDELLIATYPQRPMQSDSGLRTRRRELYDQGLLRATGETALTECQRKSAVWEITDKGRDVLAAHGRIPF